MFTCSIDTMGSDGSRDLKSFYKLLTVNLHEKNLTSPFAETHMHIAFTVSYISNLEIGITCLQVPLFYMCRLSARPPYTETEQLSSLTSSDCSLTDQSKKLEIVLRFDKCFV